MSLLGLYLVIILVFLVLSQCVFDTYLNGEFMDFGSLFIM